MQKKYKSPPPKRRYVKDKNLSFIMKGMRGIPLLKQSADVRMRCGFAPKKAKTTSSAGKVMATIFSDTKGIDNSKFQEFETV